MSGREDVVDMPAGLLAKVLARAIELVTPDFVAWSKQTCISCCVMREPSVKVIAATPTTSGVVALVLAHFRYSYSPQSGSDWGEHEIRVYELVIADDGAITGERLVKSRAFNVTENEEREYDDDGMTKLVASDVLTTIAQPVARPEPPPPPLVPSKRYLERRRYKGEQQYWYVDGNPKNPDPRPDGPAGFDSADALSCLAIYRDRVQLHDAYCFSRGHAEIYVECAERVFRHDDPHLVAALAEKQRPEVIAEVARVLALGDAAFGWKE